MNACSMPKFKLGSGPSTSEVIAINFTQVTLNRMNILLPQSVLGSRRNKRNIYFFHCVALFDKLIKKVELKQSFQLFLCFTC